MKRFDCSALVFDLDGVLVDSTALVERQWRRWATSRGLLPEPFLRVCHGRRALETIQLAAPHLDAAAEVAALIPGDDAEAGPVHALPGAVRLLTALPPDSWAVATSGTRLGATARLEQAGLPRPGVLICGEDVERGKPSPEAYLLAATELGVAPEQCLVLEDAPAGIQAARAAGMPVVGITTSHRHDELLADACATSLAAVHLGRIDRGRSGTVRLEMLVVES